MKQHALWSLYSQAFKYLRMAQRKLNHFSYFPDFVPESSYIFIRDPGDSWQFFCRLIADFYRCTVTYNNRVNNRFYRDDDKVNPSTHDIQFYYISPGYDSAFQIMGKICLTPLDLKGLSGCEQDFFGLGGLNLSYMYPVINTYSGIASHCPVYANDSGIAVLRIAWPDYCGSPFCTFNAYNIPSM